MLKNNRSGTQTMRGLYQSSVRAGWLVASVLAPGIALAALGGDASTVERDVTQLRAVRSVTATAAFSVHELQTAEGGTVREYVSPSNKVFAVVWKGPIIPDMQSLLGAYFARFSKAAQAIGRVRRGVALEESDLVIRTGGHQRGFFGVAYLPGQMPQGVTLDAIR
jgi:hypothetical protein